MLKTAYSCKISIMMRFIRNSLKPRNILFFIALFLLLSLSLHTVIHHGHPGEMSGNEIQAVLHGNDKKWWILLLLASFILALSCLLKRGLANIQSAFVCTSAFRLTFYFSKIFDPIRKALRRGILHPKLCE